MPETSFPEFGEENLACAAAIPIIGHPDLAVFVLHSIGIGNTGAFIEEEAIVPGRTVIRGKLRREMTATFEPEMIHQ